MGAVVAGGTGNDRVGASGDTSANSLSDALAADGSGLVLLEGTSLDASGESNDGNGGELHFDGVDGAEANVSTNDGCKIIRLLPRISSREEHIPKVMLDAMERTEEEIEV